MVEVMGREGAAIAVKALWIAADDESRQSIQEAEQSRLSGKR